MPGEGWRSPGVGCSCGGGGALPPEPWTPPVFTVHLPGGLTALWGRCGGLRFAAAASWAWLSCICFEHQPCARLWSFPSGALGPSVPPAGPPPCQDPGLRSCSLCAPPLSVGSQVALVVKNPPASAGDGRNRALTPGSGRSPGGGHGNPLHCSCLENPMDRGTWWVTVHRVAKSQTRLK